MRTNPLLKVLMDACGCRQCRPAPSQGNKQGSPCETVRRAWNRLKNPTIDITDERVSRWKDQYKNN